MNVVKPVSTDNTGSQLTAAIFLFGWHLVAVFGLFVSVYLFLFSEARIEGVYIVIRNSVAVGILSWITIHQSELLITTIVRLCSFFWAVCTVLLCVREFILSYKLSHNGALSIMDYIAGLLFTDTIKTIQKLQSVIMESLHQYTLLFMHLY